MWASCWWQQMTAGCPRIMSTRPARCSWSAAPSRLTTIMMLLRNIHFPLDLSMCRSSKAARGETSIGEVDCVNTAKSLALDVLKLLFLLYFYTWPCNIDSIDHICADLWLFFGSEVERRWREADRRLETRHRRGDSARHFAFFAHQWARWTSIDRSNNRNKYERVYSARKCGQGVRSLVVAVAEGRGGQDPVETRLARLHRAPRVRNWSKVTVWLQWLFLISFVPLSFVSFSNTDNSLKDSNEKASKKIVDWNFVANWTSLLIFMFLEMWNSRNWMRRANWRLCDAPSSRVWPCRTRRRPSSSLCTGPIFINVYSFWSFVLFHRAYFVIYFTILFSSRTVSDMKRNLDHLDLIPWNMKVPTSLFSPFPFPAPCWYLKIMYYIDKNRVIFCLIFLILIIVL